MKKVVKLLKIFCQIFMNDNWNMWNDFKHLWDTQTYRRGSCINDSFLLIIFTLQKEEAAIDYRQWYCHLKPPTILQPLPQIRSTTTSNTADVETSQENKSNDKSTLSWASNKGKSKIKLRKEKRREEKERRRTSDWNSYKMLIGRREM